DPRRHVELVLVGDETADGVEPVVRDEVTGTLVVGYLDYKLDYPEPGDATVNLLLVLPSVQSQGIGGACARDLERRLSGRSRRMLASIFGDNPRARRFWERLGFRFAIDAKPHLDWYAKDLAQARPRRPTRRSPRSAVQRSAVPPAAPGGPRAAVTWPGVPGAPDKTVVSVSLGSARRDADEQVELLGHRVRMVRRGVGGDLEAARRLVGELDGRVDAIGLGGTDLYLKVGDRRYTIRDAARIAAAAKRTPVVCGAGL